MYKNFNFFWKKKSKDEAEVVQCPFKDFAETPFWSFFN